MGSSKRIAVVGERDASKTAKEMAREVGAELARRKAILICGGMGGVMEAASQGCSENGGIVIGILPTADARDANPFVTVPIVTAMEEGRNTIVVRSAQALIAIGGSYGTLSEIAFALRFGIPVIGLQTWTFSRAPGDADAIVRVTSAHEAVEKAFELARE